MSQHVSSPGDESQKGRTYLLVVLCETAVIIALWWFGRVFSR
jgi:hypothetical protein